MSTSRWLTWTPPNSRIIEKSTQPKVPKIPENTSGTSGTDHPRLSQRIERVSREGASPRSVFPHCPRCSSFDLYRKNNIGNYECLTCELQDIDETAARRLQ